MFGLLERARAGLAGAVSQAKNKEFMEAAMAGCALVAAADGEIEDAEKAKMAKFIERSPELAAFDRTRMIAVFNKFADQIDFDFKMGKDAVLGEVREVPGDEQRILLMRLLVAIAGSDGEIEPAERKVLVEVARVLGLSPGEFIPS